MRIDCKQEAMELLDHIAQKIKKDQDDVTLALDVLFSCFQEHRRHQDDHKYGRIDAASAFWAIRYLFEAFDAMCIVQEKIEESKRTLDCISDELYAQSNQKGA